MDQYLDNRHKEIVWTLLQNPADTGHVHLSTLQRLVNDNPQSGLLQVLLARAGGSQDMKKAAAYFNAKTLHKLVHSPESLAVVDDVRIINSQLNTRQAAIENYFSIPIAEEEAPEITTQTEPTPEGLLQPDPEAESNSNEQETIEVPVELQPEVAEGEPQTTEVEIASDSLDNEPETTLLPNEQESEEIPESAHQEEFKDEPITHQENSEKEKEEPAPFGIETVIPELEKPEIQEELAVENTFAIAEEPEPEPQFDTISVDNGYRDEKEYFRQDIEDEIYDEIVGIEEIGNHKPAEEPVFTLAQQEPTWPETEEQEYAGDVAEDEQAVETVVVPVSEQPAEVTEPVTEVEDEKPSETNNISAETAQVHADEEKLILGNIVSADYLSFDKKLDELRNGNQNQVETKPTTEAVGETQNVSRYNDDSLPYSFMWWLDKTRKEHANSFQPYSANPVAESANTQQAPADEANNPVETAEEPAAKPVHRKAPDELQQQYYENIFSLSSISSIEADEHEAAVAFDHNKKEDIIIERFITTEPQIKPPAANKLDNENKAKKSSEDQDALVTETLARIYTDQMLYHKAIATYKKLLLKFPEKKLYFASQIEQLENKTN